MSGGDYIIKMCEHAILFVNPFGGGRKLGATKDGESSSDQACGHTYMDWCAGVVVVANPE